jgi:uncharacterized protein (DUF1810 family)
MTLFHALVPQSGMFEEALAKHFGGELDPRTLDLMRANPSAWF